MTPGEATQIEGAFNRALEGGGARIRFDTKSQAIVWRVKVNKWRAQRRKESAMLADSDDPATRARAGTTPWDELIVSIEDTSVLIYPRPQIKVEPL